MSLFFFTEIHTEMFRGRTHVLFTLKGSEKKIIYLERES